MSEEAKAVQEASKAIQEMAKTATEYRASIEKIGRFISGPIAPLVSEAAGLITDSLRYRRMKNAINYQAKIEELLELRGVTNLKPLPLATAYPLLEAASLEEDATLADMFANLFVSYVDAERDGYLPKLFATTLSALSPYEVRILKAINDAPASSMDEHGTVYTLRLPQEYMSAPALGDDVRDEPGESLEIALRNLQRLGCVDGLLTAGGETMRQVALSVYGRAFLSACGIRP